MQRELLLPVHWAPQRVQVRRDHDPAKRRAREQRGGARLAHAHERPSRSQPAASRSRGRGSTGTCSSAATSPVLAGKGLLCRWARVQGRRARVLRRSGKAPGSGRPTWQGFGQGSVRSVGMPCCHLRGRRRGPVASALPGRCGAGSFAVRRPGRPGWPTVGDRAASSSPLPARPHALKVLYGDDEHAKILYAAEIAGLRPSSYVAAAALGHG